MPTTTTPGGPSVGSRSAYLDLECVLETDALALYRRHGQDIGLVLSGRDGGAVDGVADFACQVARAAGRIRVLPGLAQLKDQRRGQLLAASPNRPAWRPIGRRAPNESITSPGNP